MDGGTATDWTNPRTWQWASLWMTAVTAPGEPFVVDFEPYFASGKYPSYSLALAQAISPLAEVAKARGNQLWMVPGTRALRTEGDVISRTAYIPAAVLNGMLPGKLVNCDESMYGLSPEVRPENWRTILSTAATDSLWAGEQYMPGLLVESLKDEELQLELESKKMASWVYATPTQLQSIPSWEAATES